MALSTIFYSGRPKGRYAIYLCDDTLLTGCIGLNDLIQVIKDELGISPRRDNGVMAFFSGFNARCIGLCDQPLGAPVNQTIIGLLTPNKLKRLLADLVAKRSTGIVIQRRGEGRKWTPQIQAHIRTTFATRAMSSYAKVAGESGLENACRLSAATLLDEIPASGLRGSRGAGYPVLAKAGYGFSPGYRRESRHLQCR